MRVKRVYGAAAVACALSPTTIRCRAVENSFYIDKAGNGLEPIVFIDVSRKGIEHCLGTGFWVEREHCAVIIRATELRRTVQYAIRFGRTGGGGAAAGGAGRRAAGGG